MSSVETQTIQLLFQPTLKVAGEVIGGEVLLFFPGLMKDKVEEVHVKLRGFVLTKITRQTGQSSTTYRQRVYMAMENISLWSMGNGMYPPPGTDILRIPFNFTLPSVLLPSCDYGGSGSKVARVRYFIEVVGKRPGIWRFNERLVTAFPVLPPSTQGAQLREVLQSGWQGPWRTIVEEKIIRRGIWGEYSRVHATLIMPDIKTIPVFAPIPFTLTIVTHSKTMKRDEKAEDEVIFPAPPLTPQEVDFRLESDVWLKARSWHTTRHDNWVTQLGGLNSGDPSAVALVSVDAAKKVWVPDGEKSEKGRWKQEVVFRSSFQLSCAPTFSSETMIVSYKLKLKVDFPGIGNSLKIEDPVEIVSSMYPPGERSWDGPPPEFTLPPDYFQGGWEEDTKDEKD